MMHCEGGECGPGAHSGMEMPMAVEKKFKMAMLEKRKNTPGQARIRPQNEGNGGPAEEENK